MQSKVKKHADYRQVLPTVVVSIDRQHCTIRLVVFIKFHDDVTLTHWYLFTAYWTCIVFMQQSSAKQLIYCKKLEDSIVNINHDEIKLYYTVTQ